MRIDDLLARLKGVRGNGDGAWMACCPAHEDKNPSMSVRVVDASGKIGVHCFAGCQFPSICSALGIEARDLMGDDKPYDPRGAGGGAASGGSAAGAGTKEKKGRAAPRKKMVASYDYHDAQGRIVFQVVRYEPKTFSQRVPDPADPSKWLWGRSRHGVGETIYRLPKVLDAAKSGKKVIFVVEGEKDVAALEYMGCVATCNPGGAGKWRSDFAEHFRGAMKVCVIADNDPGQEAVGPGKEYWQGQRHATAVLQSLQDAGIPAVAMVLPEEMGGKAVKDASDWTAAGGDRAALWDLVKAAPEWPAELYRMAGPASPLPPEGEVFPKVDVGGGSQDGKDLEIAGVKIDLDVPLWTNIAKAIFQAGNDKEKQLSTTERRAVISAVVVAWLLKRGRFFWHADLQDHASSMYFDGVRKELMVIDSDCFASWIARESQQNRTGRDYQFAVADVHDTALCAETARGIIPEAYWARRANAIYLSCGDGAMAKIAGGNVAMVPNGTDDVLFAAGKTLAPWNLLAGDGLDPFQHSRLFRDLACESPHGPMLTKLWFLSLAACHKCKPPLVLAGGPGSGKTRTAVGFFEILGMPSRISAIAENGENDFWTSLDFGGLCCFDNADTRVQWLPDAMAAAATDGSHEKRRMYSDSDLIQQRAKAHAVITSANATFAADAGLADRLIVVRLNRRNKDTAESALGAEIEAKRDAFVTWIARAHAKAGVCHARARDTGINRRHPDFAAYALRLAAGLGCEEDAVQALTEAESDKSRFALENDMVGGMLMQVMGARADWEGTCAELSTLICAEIEGLDERTKRDLGARKLSRRIEKLWFHLESVFDASKRILAGRALYAFHSKQVDEVDLKGLLANSHREAKAEGLIETTPLNPPHPPKRGDDDLIPIDLDDYRVGRDF